MGAVRSGHGLRPTDWVAGRPGPVPGPDLQPRLVRAGTPPALPDHRPLAGRPPEEAQRPDPERLADRGALQLPLPRRLRPRARDHQAAERRVHEPEPRLPRRADPRPPRLHHRAHRARLPAPSLPGRQGAARAPRRGAEHAGAPPPPGRHAARPRAPRHHGRPHVARRGVAAQARDPGAQALLRPDLGLRAVAGLRSDRGLRLPGRRRRQDDVHGLSPPRDEPRGHPARRRPGHGPAGSVPPGDPRGRRGRRPARRRDARRLRALQRPAAVAGARRVRAVPAGAGARGVRAAGGAAPARHHARVPRAPRESRREGGGRGVPRRLQHVLRGPVAQEAEPDRAARDAARRAAPPGPGRRRTGARADARSQPAHAGDPRGGHHPPAGAAAAGHPSGPGPARRPPLHQPGRREVAGRGAAPAGNPRPGASRRPPARLRPGEPSERFSRRPRRCGPRSPRPLVVVVLKGYPRVSETFIAHELAALERRGLPLHIVSLRRPYDALTHPVHATIRGAGHVPAGVPPRGAGPRARGPRPGARARAAPLRAGARAVAPRRPARPDAEPRPALRPGRRARGRAAGRRRAPPRPLPPHAGLRRALRGGHERARLQPRRAREGRLDDAGLGAPGEARRGALHRDLHGGRAHPPGRARPGRVELVYHGLDRQLFARAAGVRVATRRHRPGRPGAAPGRRPLPAQEGLPDPLRGRGARAGRFRLTVVGYGPLEAALRARVEALGLADRVTWAGALDQPAVRAQYRASDLLLLASEVAPDGDRDGLPNVVVEALSQGLPVVATRAAAIPELVRDGRPRPARPAGRRRRARGGHRAPGARPRRRGAGWARRASRASPTAGTSTPGPTGSTGSSGRRLPPRDRGPRRDRVAPGVPS